MVVFKLVQSKIWTVTSGKVKIMKDGCEILHVRGAVTFHQDVLVKRVSVFGQGSFQESVIADSLENSGVCIIKGMCKIQDIKNIGHLHLYVAKVSDVESLGYLKIDKLLDCECLNV